MLVVAVALLVVLVYTYVGYPVLIAVLARRWPAPPSPVAPSTPMVSALIPVHNARRYIDEKIDSLLAQDYPADQIEILLCSDGSDDGSDELLAERAARDPRIRPLRPPR